MFVVVVVAAVVVVVVAVAVAVAVVVVVVGCWLLVVGCWLLVVCCCGCGCGCGCGCCCCCCCFSFFSLCQKTPPAPVLNRLTRPSVVTVVAGLRGGVTHGMTSVTVHHFTGWSRCVPLLCLGDWSIAWQKSGISKMIFRKRFGREEEGSTVNWFQFVVYVQHVRRCHQI